MDINIEVYPLKVLLEISLFLRVFTDWITFTSDVDNYSEI